MFSSVSVHICSLFMEKVISSKRGMLAHDCNLSTLGVEAKWSWAEVKRDYELNPRTAWATLWNPVSTKQTNEQTIKLNLYVMAHLFNLSTCLFNLSTWDVVAWELGVLCQSGPPETLLKKKKKKQLVLISSFVCGSSFINALPLTYIPSPSLCFWIHSWHFKFTD